MNIQLNPLVDFLVENISNDSAPYVRSQYDKLIAERDTSDVWRQFAIWLLIDPDHGVIRFTEPNSKQHVVIKHVAYLYLTHCKDRELWEYNADAAYHAAADAADDAAAWAAYAAASAAADSTAYATAYAAARASTAEAEAHKHMADKLLELLQSAPHLDTTR